MKNALHIILCIVILASFIHLARAYKEYNEYKELVGYVPSKSERNRRDIDEMNVKILKLKKQIDNLKEK
jgi:hypothetical protein